VPTIATIGVYGFDGPSFLTTLERAGVKTLVDVRQRRGVRGSEYAWANSQRLQSALEKAGIGYLHMKELAPSTEMRQLQYREDERRDEGKRSRTALAPEFARLYTETVLDPADLAPLLELAETGLPALMCVERDQDACHRSLIASRLQREKGFEVIELRPG
jgi:uncharacterized protein (DUF488 family)